MTVISWTVVFSLSFLMAYFSPLGLPLAIIFGGLLNLWSFKHIGSLEMANKALILTLMMFLTWLIARSDLVFALIHGQNLMSAYKLSKHQFWPIIIISITATAWVLGVTSLKPEYGQKITQFMGIGLFAFISIMLIEAITQGGLSQFWRLNLINTNRPERVLVWLSDANTVFLFLFWPIAYWLTRLGRAFLAPLLGLVIIMISLKVDTNAQILALIISASIFFLITFLSAKTRLDESTIGHGLGLLMAAFVLLFPIGLTVFFMNPASDVLIKTLPQSWEHRMQIWEFTLQMAEKKWLYGWGLESARLFDPYIPTHPHSMALHALLELGVIGLILLSLFWYLAALSIAKLKTPAWDQISPIAYGLAGLSAVYTINSLSYGLWRSWLYSSAILMVIILMMIVRYGPTEPKDEEYEQEL